MDDCARVELCRYDPRCPFYARSNACQSPVPPTVHRTSYAVPAGKVPQLGEQLAMLVDGRGVSTGTLVEITVLPDGDAVLTWEYEL